MGVTYTTSRATESHAVLTTSTEPTNLCGLLDLWRGDGNNGAMEFNMDSVFATSDPNGVLQFGDRPGLCRRILVQNRRLFLKVSRL